MDRVTNEFDDESFLFLRVGDAKPFWTLTDDSNVLWLGARPNIASVTAELDNQDAGRIRSIGGEVQRVQCPVNVSGTHLTLFLIGRLLTSGMWRGIATADARFVPTDEMMAALRVTVPDNVLKFPIRKFRE